MPLNQTSGLLVGYTGFVGSNLARQHAFADLANSKNIEQFANRKYDVIVCAGISGIKWWANQNPIEDWRNIQKLLDVLRTMEARRFVLISTIDVYPDPRGGIDENSDPRHLPNHGYGQHRMQFEVFIRSQFHVHHVVRLPGLFGAGLKKNVIFDLLHDNCLEAINPSSAFQYYDLARLWCDLNRIVASELPIVNLATEPVPTSAILSRFFADKTVGAKASPTTSYDFRSRYAALWGGTNGYLYDAHTVLSDLARFIAAERDL